MTQEEAIARLSAAIERQAEAFHQFQVHFAALDASREQRLTRLEQSEETQWKIIRATQARMMKLIYLISGAVSVIAFLDLPSKIRALLMR
jgi:hypothetical protein